MRALRQAKGRAMLRKSRRHVQFPRNIIGLGRHQTAWPQDSESPESPRTRASEAHPRKEDAVFVSP